MSNRFTRVPAEPVPPLPAAARALVPAADLFMLLMLSRPATGSLRRTWVTPATLWLSLASSAGGLALSIAVIGRGASPLLAASIGLLALGAGAVAGVGVGQRRGPRRP